MLKTHFLSNHSWKGFQMLVVYLGVVIYIFKKKKKKFQDKIESFHLSQQIIHNIEEDEGAHVKHKNSYSPQRFSKENFSPLDFSLSTCL